MHRRRGYYFASDRPSPSGYSWNHVDLACLQEARAVRLVTMTALRTPLSPTQDYLDSFCLLLFLEELL
jgi:hypothetical protein